MSRALIGSVLVLALAGCGQSSRVGTTQGDASTESAEAPLQLVLSSGVRARVVSNVMRIGLSSQPDAETIDLHVDELRRGVARMPLPLRAARMDGDRIAIARADGVTEWWRPSAGQLEFGFTLDRRPLGDAGEPLVVPLEFEGVSSEVTEATVTLTRSGHFAARIDALDVRDATGARVAARFVTQDGRASIEVRDAGAVYPLTIDPILGVLTKFVETAPVAGFGERVALEGDVAVVTAATLTAPGSARVYRRSAGTWALETTLTGTDQHYGRNVSLSGEALVVGNVLYDHTSGSWVQVTTFPSTVVAVGGDTLAAGNELISPSHLVLWTRGAGGWAQSGTLNPGYPLHVTIAGNKLAVVTKATNQNTDFVYTVKIYTGSGSSWTLANTFAPSTLDHRLGSGGSEGSLDLRGVALTDDTIGIVSSSPPGSGGGYFLYLGSPLGTSASLQRFSVGSTTGINIAAVSGLVMLGRQNTNLGTKTEVGDALVFGRTGTTWTLRSSITAPVTFNSDAFGTGVALSGEEAMIGAGEYSNGGVIGTKGMVFTLKPVLAWPNGHACALGGECTSGSCVDGVCCNAACSESCKACNLVGSVGTCIAVPTDSLPVGTRLCAPAKRCAAGGVCASSCTSASDCAAGGACLSNTCSGKRGNGSPCSVAADCTSNFCVDGICCDTSCTDQCMACDVPTKQGTCWKVTGAPHSNGGTRAACAGAGAGTECGPVCDGNDGVACHHPADGVVACGADVCDATTRVETRRGSCDGAGACGGGSVSCGAYACGTTTCKNTCAGAADCAPGYVCGTDSLCKAISTFGAACVSQSDCESPLTCVDGACCGQATCPTGSSCNLSGSKGECRKNLGTACTSNAECSAGKTCTDGVCCDKACAGTCEACDVAGKLGTCVPVTGAPRATRTACPAATDICGARQCDGNARTTCEAYATAKGTECKPSACGEAGLQPRSTCDGAGGCLSPSVQQCGNYVCADGACKTKCDRAEDCTGGFICAADGRCVEGARCSDDGLSSISKGGTVRPCAPYRCSPTGLCFDRCAESGECASGSACDTATSTCLASAPTGGDDGGCATRAPRGSPGAGLVALAVALVALGRQRHRRQRTALTRASRKPQRTSIAIDR